MIRRSFLTIFALALASSLAVAAEQPAPASPAGMSEMRNGTLQWGPIDLPGFVPGMKISVLSGDPNKEGPYTLRLLFPAGYYFPAHWHPNVENLTVVSGTLKLAMGDKTDKAKLKTYTAGDYLHIPPQHPHFGGADVETVIQLHGPGPFGVTVIEAMAGALPMPSPVP